MAEIEKKERQKAEFARKRKYLEAQEMKTGIMLLQKQLLTLREGRPRHKEGERDLGIVSFKKTGAILAANEDQIMETYEKMKSDVIVKLSQTKQVLLVYYNKLTSEDLAALERLQARLDVLAADNDTKLKSAMKRFAKDVMDTEQKMHELAEKEEYKAANEAKTHLVWLHKQIKVLRKYDLNESLEEFSKLYNTKKQHKDIACPAGVSLNVHGEFQIYLTYVVVSRVLKQRVMWQKAYAQSVQETLGKLCELVERVVSPDTAEAANSTRAHAVVKRILSTVAQLTSKASVRVGAATAAGNRSGTSRRRGSEGPPPHPPTNREAKGRITSGAASWGDDSDRARSSNGAIARTNTQRALAEMSSTMNMPPTPIRMQTPKPPASSTQCRPRTRGGAQEETPAWKADSVANLETEIHDLIDYFSPMRAT